MALSNIFREPRREITESVVGIGIVALVVGAFLWVDYHTTAQWFSRLNPDVPMLLNMTMGALVLAIGSVCAFFIGAGMLVITHEIGEASCNALERRGIHLRPRVRP